MSPKTSPEDQAKIRHTRYKENCDQARHHETLREKTTSMVAQTTGVMLGLFGFKEQSWQHNPIVTFIPLFIIVLGLWGIFSVTVAEFRIQRHRERILEIRKEWDDEFEAEKPTKITRWIWWFFHGGIVVLGGVLWHVTR